MFRLNTLSITFVLLISTLLSRADTHYVSLSGTHTAPYTNWIDSATNIQAAVNAAVAGDTVLVTNGTYVLSSEISVSDAIAVQSASGPEHTIVDGVGAVRCFNLAGTACVLSGFTITNGLATGPHPADYGGGIYCLDLTPVITNCIIVGNTATSGGGVFYGSIYNSVLTGNSATANGGGFFGSTAANALLIGNTANKGSALRSGSIINCTVVENVATDTGAVYDGSVSNSIVWNNTAVGASNNLHVALAFHSCSPELQNGVDGNLNSDPKFVGPGIGNYRLLWGSPCIDSGTNGVVAAAHALDGNDRVLGGIVDMGAYEYDITVYDSDGDGLTDDDEVNLHGTNPLKMDTDDDGLSDDEEVNLHGTSPILADTDTDGLDDAYEISNGGNPLIADVSPVHYVSLAGAGIYPYTNWLMAATNIQSAVDAASSNDLVRVADGTYSLSAEVVVDRAITIQSENGREATVVDGGGTVRCFNLSADSIVLSGFSIMNGYAAGGDGGGVLCSTVYPIVTNCLISACVAGSGGGMSGGTARDCIISNNVAGSAGGGLFSAVALHCIISDNTASGSGGGAAFSIAYFCEIYRNTANYDGGGMYEGWAFSCAVHDNSAQNVGGGFSFVDARNCTVCWNTATYSGGGVYDGMTLNCIVWYNDANQPYGGILSDNDIHALLYVSISNTCSPGLIAVDWSGCVTSLPKFVDAGFNDFRLVPTSPCVNAGANSYVQSAQQVVDLGLPYFHTTEDLVGMPRISGGTVDMGAYEYDAVSSDTDNDGLSDSYEVANGLSPSRYTDMGALMQSNAANYGYFTENQVLDLAVGDIGVEITNGMAQLSVQLWQTDDLITWTNLGGTVYFAEPVGADKKFFRIRAAP